MHLTKNDELDKILQNAELGTVDAEVMFLMQREASLFYYDNVEKTPSRESYLAAADFVRQKTGIDLNLQQIERILSLFPLSRIRLAVESDLDDSEVQESTLEAIYAFFGSTDTLTLADGIDVERYNCHLRRQAAKMGFCVFES